MLCGLWILCVRCIGPISVTITRPDVTASPQPAWSIRAERECVLIFHCLPSTITPILLFDCYRIVFNIICIPGKYSISIGEHYCKMLGLREGIFLVFFNLCSCNILYLGQYLPFTGRDNIWCGSEWDNNGSFYSLPNLLLRWDRKYYSPVNTMSPVPTSSQHHNKTSVQRIQIGFVRISLLQLIIADKQGWYYW